ncbi:RHS repeat-associated core domain-containing protein [Caproicibacter sp.]|uniref:RHS repeat-associated core domain-containing protein n=1 Tax=Caproicibacter sp. TaxID=2814884 RepID=UPI003989EAA5
MQSRYYNPEIGRFISKDDSGYHDASDPVDSNLYAYVNNNPVINTDANGHFINTILGGLFGAGYGWLSAKLTGGNPQAGAVSGLFGGMIAGAGADLAVAFPATGAISTIAAYASAFVSQIIYIGMTEKNLDAKYFTRPEVAGSIIFCTILGGTFICLVPDGVIRLAMTNLQKN